MKVVQITYKQAMKWCIEMHYQHRKPMYQIAFGLVEDGKIQGVVVYGTPPVQIQKKIKGWQPDLNVFELNRLVVQTETKNACSFLVGNSLKMLPTNSIVVSYADASMGHHGIVYQSTNWIYTGKMVPHDREYIIDGKRVHPRTLVSRGITAPKKWAEENGYESVPLEPKHRYFYILGSKKLRKRLLKDFPYEIVSEYPKGDKTMYDLGPSIVMGEDGHKMGKFVD